MGSVINTDCDECNVSWSLFFDLVLKCSETFHALCSLFGIRITGEEGDASSPGNVTQHRN